MKKDSFYRKLSTSELIDFIIKKYHQSLRLNNPKILKDLDYLTNKYKHKEQKIALIYELYMKFDNLIIKHIDKEEKIFFKAIKNLEKTIEVCKNIDPESVNECRNFIEQQEKEHMNIDELLMSIEKLTLNLKAINDPRFYEFLHKTNSIIYETKEHAKIEDFYLNEKIEFYLNLI